MENKDVIFWYGKEALDLLNAYFLPENVGTWEQVFIANALEEKFNITIEKDEEWTKEAPLFAFYGYYGELVRTI